MFADFLRTWKFRRSIWVSGTHVYWVFKKHRCDICRIVFKFTNGNKRMQTTHMKINFWWKNLIKFCVMFSCFTRW